MVALYLKPEIYYMLPNNEQIELLSEMQKANFYFNDFDEPVADLRQAYQETKNEDELKVIVQRIEHNALLSQNFSELKAKRCNRWLILMICLLA